VLAARDDIVVLFTVAGLLLQVEQVATIGSSAHDYTLGVSKGLMIRHWKQNLEMLQPSSDWMILPCPHAQGDEEQRLAQLQHHQASAKPVKEQFRLVSTVEVPPILSAKLSTCLHCRNEFFHELRIDRLEYRWWLDDEILYPFEQYSAGICKAI
jgi:hypothetical protein